MNGKSDEAGSRLVQSTDGTPIAVWRGGAGPNLLLVHGTAADHTRWARTRPLFERHFTVWAMDRRGRGGSGDGSRYSIVHEAHDIAAVATAIGGAVSILGHSYGALCCVEAAPALPRLHRLVLYEPPMPVGERIVAPAAVLDVEQCLAAGDPEAALLTFFRRVVRVPEQQLDVMRATPAWAGRVAAAHTLPREIRLEGEYRPELARLRAVHVPALLLLGGDSPAFFHEAVRRLHESMPGSRVHVMPGQQHVAMDMITEDFVQLVTRFVLGVDATPPDGADALPAGVRGPAS
jgi:pimeloyl-ACP methyl ester carboxylesterase